MMTSCVLMVSLDPKHYNHEEEYFEKLVPFHWSAYILSNPPLISLGRNGQMIKSVMVTQSNM